MKTIATIILFWIAFQMIVIANLRFDLMVAVQEHDTEERLIDWKLYPTDRIIITLFPLIAFATPVRGWYEMCHN